ncbi:hypothetical protein [Piscinibacter terrae]|uniref:hypothetical protein n=1 Tax=Piscinibacter terrae TaxID=2496871 RepID=UPI000F5A4E49|nr:hypothetical protein [Albitalea terrae]
MRWHALGVLRCISKLIQVNCAAWRSIRLDVKASGTTLDRCPALVAIETPAELHAIRSENNLINIVKIAP